MFFLSNNETDDVNTSLFVGRRRWVEETGGAEYKSTGGGGRNGGLVGTVQSIRRVLRGVVPSGICRRHGHVVVPVVVPPRVVVVSILSACLPIQPRRIQQFGSFSGCEAFRMVRRPSGSTRTSRGEVQPWQRLWLTLP
mgnify:CR=1 FL=1